MPNESMLDYLTSLFTDVDFPDAWVAVLGNFDDGFSISGPFMSAAEATSWAELNHLKGDNWDICRLHEAQ
jgi:hypothetical protein